MLRPALISSLVHHPYKHFKPPVALCSATSAGRLPDDWAVTYTVMADLNHGGRVSVGYLPCVNGNVPLHQPTPLHEFLATDMTESSWPSNVWMH